jgi:hypothetical protein
MVPSSEREISAHQGACKSQLLRASFWNAGLFEFGGWSDYKAPVSAVTQIPASSS